MRVKGRHTLPPSTSRRRRPRHQHAARRALRAGHPHRESEEAAEMTAETHPDPFQDAMGHGLQRAVQVTSCAVTAAQVYIHQQRSQAIAATERDERARRALAAQIRAEREAAHVGWAPALAPDWLAQAALHQAAYTSGPAMPYAARSAPGYQPAAAPANRK